ncbi:hypothetical protein L3V82_07875 [Thiotrichales bacterium 19S3-7]|nr:hypothetical protein [Thiotrichales bacterium 19S3-7]MCF6802077.1 hypothetical protein [Thiotrichales bacterium 19S3-11]
MKYLVFVFFGFINFNLLYASSMSVSKYASSMSVSQDVTFEGFKGAQFMYILPNDSDHDQYCNDHDVTSEGYQAPVQLPSTNPIDNSSDHFSMHFNYTLDDYIPPIDYGSSVSCIYPLTTVITWQSDNQQKECIFTILIGGGASNKNYGIAGEKKKHMCKIGDDNGNGMDCQVNGCEPMTNSDDHDDFGGGLWVVSPKS